MLDRRPTALSLFARWSYALALASVLNACSAARPDPQPSAVRATEPTAEVRSIALTVVDLDGAQRFFTQVLGAQPEGPPAALSGPELSGLLGTQDAKLQRARLRVGSELVELVQYDGAPGRPIPLDSRSDDGWFQHLALVTRDIDGLEARVLGSGASAISRGTQTIPASNEAAGGIRAFYFRGPAAHPLELIWYPAGRGLPRWQHGDTPLLGIDHTAIAVTDSERASAFYTGMLGLRVAGHSLNFGDEQAALSGVDAARVRITGMRGHAGPGVELLEYETPRAGRPMPADSSPSDAWYAEITLAVPDLDATVAQLRAAGTRFISDRIHDTHELVPGTQRGIVVRDPDGHAVRLVQ